MTRAERAKIFAPFDAMKGLQEALRDREERHLRVEKHGVSEEDAERNSRMLLKLQKGMKAEISYYRAFHDIVRSGVVTELNTAFRVLKLDDERILFDDIYTIKITD
jgi:hypothetical protein